MAPMASKLAAKNGMNANHPSDDNGVNARCGFQDRQVARSRGLLSTSYVAGHEVTTVRMLALEHVPRALAALDSAAPNHS